MKNKKLILVVSRGYGNSYFSPFYELGKFTDNLKSIGKMPIDLVIFTGGADVSPEFYGEEEIKETYADKSRDLFEINAFNMAHEAKLPMFGICRGAQLLCVMAGGKLIQHVSNHTGGYHSMRTNDGELIEVNSLHHQMQVPPKNAQVLAWAEPSRSRVYLPGPAPEQEVECAYYPNIKAVGVQYHPEMMRYGSAGLKYTQNLARKLMSDPDSLLDSNEIPVP